MGIEPFMVASSVIGVEAQRLVRRICEQCVVPDRPAIEQFVFYESIGGKGSTFKRGTGCAHCSHTGFHGRIGIFEVLKVTDSVKQLIVRNAPPEALRKQVIENGMTTLRESGLAKIDEGLTTIGEVMRSVHVGEVVNA
jgi:type II secretory ATPase GspE/PulE/Tfp pilus assembly ATPase PilB-like protein